MKAELQTHPPPPAVEKKSTAETNLLGNLRSEPIHVCQKT